MNFVSRRAFLVGLAAAPVAASLPRGLAAAPFAYSAEHSLILLQVHADGPGNRYLHLLAAAEAEDRRLVGLRIDGVETPMAAGTPPAGHKYGGHARIARQWAETLDTVRYPQVGVLAWGHTPVRKSAPLHQAHIVLTWHPDLWPTGIPTLAGLYT